MNAHIDFDLPFAIETVKVSPNTNSRYADHQRVNDVLGEVADEIVAALGTLYGSNYAALDTALGPLDELLLANGMSAARQTLEQRATAYRLHAVDPLAGSRRHRRGSGLQRQPDAGPHLVSHATQYPARAGRLEPRFDLLCAFPVPHLARVGRSGAASSAFDELRR